MLKTELLEAAIIRELLNIPMHKNIIEGLFKDLNIPLEPLKPLKPLEYTFVMCSNDNAHEAHEAIHLPFFKRICLKREQRGGVGEDRTVIKYANGNLKEERYTLNGKNHRDDGPAIIEYNTDGSINSERYYRNGKVHRDDGPAIIDYINGSIDSEKYLRNGEVHRDDGPAVIFYNSDGSIHCEIYYRNGEGHRADAIARIEYDRNHNIIREEYLLNDKRHREDGPAVIVYYSNSDRVPKREIYYVNNKMHREDGPAFIEYNVDGDCTAALGYKDGVKTGDKYNLKDIRPFFYPQKIAIHESLSANSDDIEYKDDEFDPLS